MYSLYKSENRNHHKTRLRQKGENRENEPIQTIILYTWKCHKETPCIAILNKPKCHFFSSFTKSENRRVEQVLSGGVGTSGRGRRWEKGVGG
jgi:hypothetical protein